MLTQVWQTYFKMENSPYFIFTVYIICSLILTGVLPDCLKGGSDEYTEIEEEEMKILKEVLR